jgi:hypothetical protein
MKADKHEWPRCSEIILVQTNDSKLSIGVRFNQNWPFAAFDMEGFG